MRKRAAVLAFAVCMAGIGCTACSQNASGDKEAASTEVVTEAKTDVTTEKTEVTTEKKTEATTEKKTEATTEKKTEAATEKKTEATTEKKKTEATTEKSTEDEAKRQEEKERAKARVNKLIQNALKPVGSTMYVWGGGWNEADTGAGKEAVTIGLSPRWKEFYQQQDADYDYKKTRYQIHDGLDCSGYVGWVVYNTMETSSGKSGYVTNASKQAKFLADRGVGTYIPSSKVNGFRRGDICSMSSHVWICLEQMSDGSVLLAHSSPPGVSVCGTLSRSGKETMATRKAKAYMKEHAPEYFKKYPKYTVKHSYLESVSICRVAK